jgi:hypothetical protein
VRRLILLLALVLVAGCEKNPNWREGTIAKVEFHPAWHESGSLIMIPNGSGGFTPIFTSDEDHPAYTEVTVIDSLGYSHTVNLSGSPAGMRPGQKLVR